MCIGSREQFLHEKPGRVGVYGVNYQSYWEGCVYVRVCVHGFVSVCMHVHVMVWCVCVWGGRGRSVIH